VVVVEDSWGQRLFGGAVLEDELSGMGFGC